MALTHLADTSVLTRAARTPVRQALERLLGDRRAAVCRITRLELGFSARSEAEWDAIIAASSVFALVESVEEDLRRAEQVQRLLAARGQRGRKVPDLIVAAAAERLGLTALHYDRDFELIAAVTGQPHEWVVPAGSID